MSRKNIVVVEHDENTIEFLKDQLGQDYQILLIPSGEKAIQIVKEGYFDLAIVSQRLSDINGLEVLQKFRMRCPSLPVIFIAEAPTKDIIISAFRLGVKNVFEKPINGNEFLMSIKNVIDSGNNGKDKTHFVNCEIEKFLHHWHIARITEREKGLDAAINEYELTTTLYNEDFIREDHYENLTELDRENVKEIFLFILNKLSSYYCLNGKVETAIDLCNKIIEIDNYREDIYQRLMKCYYKIGQQDKALEQYQQCVEVLKSELQVTPTKATIRLYEEIKEHIN